MSLLKLIKESLSLDLRSLALYRILLGLIVIADVIYRLPDLTVFYTDDGILPRSVFLTELSLPWSFSLHLANGSFAFMALCFLLHLLIGVLLTLGFKTSLMTFLAWLMTVSVHNRNWLINNGGDDILRAILLISIFLPLGAYYSLDNLHQKNKEESPQPQFSIWTMTFFFQVFSIYFMSYILKDHPIWRKDYTALSYAGALDIFATPLGIYLRGFPVIQKILTVLTIFLEWIGPILLFFSFLFFRHWWRVRSLILVSFWLLHLGIILCMYIGIFPYLCLAIWCAFIPPQWWERGLENILQKEIFLSIRNFFQTRFPYPKFVEKNRCDVSVFFKRVTQVLGGLVFIGLVSWNLYTTKKINIKENVFHDLVRWLHIYQEWNMFAPHPKLDNIWLEVPSFLEDGTSVELLTKNFDIYTIKNLEFVESIQNEHWRKFYLNLSEKQEYLKYLSGYLCRQWNEFEAGFIPGKKLKNLEVNVYSQQNFLNGEHGPVRKIHSWNHWCFESDLKEELKKK